MSDPMPFKLAVLHAFADALKEITPTNGYVSDMADFDPGDGADQSRVFRGRPWFGVNDPIPMLSVLEGVSPSDEVAEMPVDSITGEYDWPLIVQGFLDDDPENPTDPAYVLLADVRRRLAVERRRKLPGSRGEPDPFGLGTGKNRISRLTIGPGVVRPADDVSARAYFWLSVVLRIVDNASEPYA